MALNLQGISRYMDVNGMRNEGIGHITHSSTVYTLIARLQGETTPGRRRDAAIALGKCGDPRAIRPLIKRMNETDPEMRLVVIRALTELGSIRAVDTLIERLRDTSELSGIREAAATGLGKIHSLRAIPVLRSCVGIGDPGVRRAAEKALAEIGPLKKKPD
jgi:HEAT repeat protein